MQFIDWLHYLHIKFLRPWLRAQFRRRRVSRKITRIPQISYMYVIVHCLTLKVHKHEIILNFFLLRSNPYMPFVNLWKKIRFFSFDFRQNFDVWTFPRWLSEHTRNQILLMSYPKILFLQNLYFSPIRWVPRRFLVKFRFFFSQNMHFRYFWVFFENFGNDFIACWAYAEPISSHTEHTRTNFRACSASGKMWTVFTCTIHAEHTRNKFYRTLSIRGTNFIACWAYAEPISSQAEHARKCLKVEYLGRIEYTIFKSLVLQALGTIWFRFLQKRKKNHACVPLKGRCIVD